LEYASSNDYVWPALDTLLTTTFVRANAALEPTALDLSRDAPRLSASRWPDRDFRSERTEAVLTYRHLVSATLVFIGVVSTGLATAQQPEVATTVAFTEGPTVDREGNVYFSEMVSLRIMKLSATGVLSTFRESSNNANGLLIDPQGRLVACEGADSQRTGVTVKFKPQITRTDLRTGKIEVLADKYDGKPFVGPNDVTIDGKGRLYFTDLPGGAVYRIDGPGQVRRILAAPEIQRPNGIQIAPDDQTLYLIEANQAEGGARMIRAYDLRADGTVSNMRVHYNFYPGRSADGMSIDTQGNLYASAGMNQLRGSSETLDTKTGVYVISPQGRLLKFIPVAEDFITNNGFGGPDMKTLYVTAGKSLYRLRTDIAGLPR
jgi:gluconolactonase